jgi:hypothetical protein
MKLRVTWGHITQIFTAAKYSLNDVPTGAGHGAFKRFATILGEPGNLIGTANTSRTTLKVERYLYFTNSTFAAWVKVDQSLYHELQETKYPIKVDVE